MMETKLFYLNWLWKPMIAGMWPSVSVVTGRMAKLSLRELIT